MHVYIIGSNAKPTAVKVYEAEVSSFAVTSYRVGNGEEVGALRCYFKKAESKLKQLPQTPI